MGGSRDVSGGGRSLRVIGSWPGGRRIEVPGEGVILRKSGV